MSDQEIVLPVRIELRAGPAGPACTFTVHASFLLKPSCGDTVIVPTGMGQYGCRVHGFYHFLPTGDEEAACVLLTDPLLLDDYDGMLRLLDWFKANFEIDDFRSDQPEPEPYYSFYRSVVQLLGRSQESRPVVAYEPVEIKIFAETCRAVALAELEGDSYEQAASSFNPAIENLHHVVLSRKRDEPDGADMLAVIKTWEAALNPNKQLKWRASFDQCVRAAQVVFKKLRSIPADRLPKSIGAPV